MIHVQNLSMDRQEDITMFENLLNKAHIDKTIKIMDVDKAFDNRGVMHIFLVYKDAEPVGRQPVKFDNVEFPTIDYGNSQETF